MINYDNQRPYSFIHLLLNIIYEAMEQNDIVWLEFMLHLKRNHAFYGIINNLFCHKDQEFFLLNVIDIIIKF